MIYKSFNDLAIEKYPMATVGELFVYGILRRNLPTDCIIHCQPSVFGGRRRPDFIVQRVNYGACIIEVKDWSMGLYHYEVERKNFLVTSTNQVLDHPVKQVKQYKDHIFEDLGYGPQKVLNSSLFGVIREVVIFTNVLDGDIYRYDTHSTVIGRKALLRDQKELLEFLGLDRRPKEYTADFHARMHTALYGSREPKEPVINVTLTKKQEESLLLPPSRRRKFRGPAGSGKTHLAIEAARRAAIKNKPVLILVYNITMRNHYKRLIERVPPAFERRLITVATFHTQLRDLLTEIAESEYIQADSAKSLLQRYLGQASSYGNDDSVTEKAVRYAIDSRLHSESKYATVIIDEGQDFKPEWMEAMESFYKEDSGEFLVFADEAQNVFSRDRDEEGKTSTNIVGQWYHLPIVFRHSGQIGALCKQYRAVVTNETVGEQQQSAFEEETIVVYECRVPSVYDRAILLTTQLLDQHPNETIAVIASSKEALVRIASLLEDVHHVRTSRIVETFIERDKLLYNAVRECHIEAVKLGDTKVFLSEIRNYLKYDKTDTSSLEPTLEMKVQLANVYEKIRHEYEKALKNSFPNPDAHVWIVTTHSMKGLQADHVVFIHDETGTGTSDHELVYTAISRARKSLTILDVLENEELRQAYERTL